MTAYILINDTVATSTGSGPTMFRAGTSISDAATIAALPSEGGLLWLATDPVVSAAATIVQKMRSHGMDEAFCSRAMLAAAINSLQLGGEGSAQSGVTRTVDLATAAALPANTYLGAGNGASSFTLTGTGNGALIVDGVAVSLTGGIGGGPQRILVANEATAKNNGIYQVVQPGTAGTPYILQRVTDMQTSADFVAGMEIMSGPAGSANPNATYQLATANPMTMDTTALTFVKCASALEGAGALATFTKAAADGAAATATAETIVGMIGASSGGPVGNVYFVPAAALTGDPANNATINVFKRTAGGATVLIATLTTTASWTQWKPVQIPTQAGATVAAGDAITYTITKGGTGVVVPAGQINVYAS
jgi:hypothetical protein